MYKICSTVLFSLSPYNISVQIKYVYMQWKNDKLTLLTNTKHKYSQYPT